MLNYVRSIVSDHQTRASLGSLAIMAIGAVLAFLMFSVVARHLGPSEFGHFVTWFNIAFFLAVIGALGQETLIGRSWNEYAGAEQWDLARGVFLFGLANVVVGSLTVFAAFVFCGWLLHVEPKILLASGAMILLHPPLSFIYQFTRAVIGHLRSDSYYEFIWRLIVIFGVMALSAYGLGLTSAWVLALVAFGFLTVTLLLMVHVLSALPPAVWAASTRTEATAWRHRSIKFWLAAIVEASGQYLDVVVVHLLLGEIAAGGYFAASRIANIFAKVALAFETRAASKLSYFYFRGDRDALDLLLQGLSSTTLFVVGLGLPIILALGKFLLPAFAEIYASEFPALAILTLGTAFVTLTGSGRLLLLHTGYEGAYLRVITFGLIARAALFFSLIPLFGTLGAALAWSATAAATSLVLMELCRRRLKIDPSVLQLFHLARPKTGSVADPSSSHQNSTVPRRRVVLLQTQAEAAGAQEIARILGAGLTNKGYDVHYGFFFRRTDAFDSIPNTFFCSVERPETPWQTLKVLVTLWRRLRALRPCSVLTLQHYGNILGAPVARLAGVSLVIANQNTARAQMKWWVKKADVILGMSGIYSKIVVNSAYTLSEYDRDPDIFRRRLVRIDHGFAPKLGLCTRSEARAMFALPQDATIIGCVARLHPDKNHAASIRLLAARPHWHLAIAGQGAQRSELEDLAAGLGVSSRLHFKGELSASQLSEFLRSLDAFVFPSRLETFGLAAVEAAQAGNPVVCNDLPVLREVLAVEGAPCALFVDVSDTVEFAKTVNRILDDEVLRSELVARGRRLIERYSLEAMVGGYSRLLGQDRPAVQAAPAVIVDA